MILLVSFFERRAEVVAEDLIGRRLVREYDHRRYVGIISETGAYEGGRASLEVAPGIITIEVFQGGNRVLCIGTEARGVASVVTIRKLLPVEGFKEVLDGPEKVVAQLHLDKELFQGVAMGSDGLWIESDTAQPSRRLGPNDIRHCAPNCLAYFHLT